jgi:hypothetical protein
LFSWLVSWFFLLVLCCDVHTFTKIIWNVLLLCFILYKNKRHIPKHCFTGLFIEFLMKPVTVNKSFLPSPSYLALPCLVTSPSTGLDSKISFVSFLEFRSCFPVGTWGTRPLASTHMPNIWHKINLSLPTTSIGISIDKVTQVFNLECRFPHCASQQRKSLSQPQDP